MSRSPKRRLLLVLYFLLIAVAFWLVGKDRKLSTSNRQANSQKLGQQEHAGDRAAHPRTGAASRFEPKPIPVQLMPVTLVERKSQLGSFGGKVVCWSTGEGIASAEITFAKLQATYSVMTDAAGAFQFSTSEHGVYHLAAVTAKGYLPFAPAWGHSPLRLISQPGKSVQNIVVFLKKAIKYRGLVVDPQGLPVPGAQVTLFIRADRQLSLVPLPDQFVTDSNGEFLFEAPDDTLVQAHHPELGSAKRRLDQSAQRSKRIVLRLTGKANQESSDRKIAGLVLDPEGIPLPDARIVVRDQQAGPFDARSSWWSALSDQEGRFRLTGLAQSRYTLSATYPEMLPAVVRAVSPGTSAVVLKMSSGAGRIVGQVTDASSGKPVLGFVVVVSERTGPLQEIPITRQSVFSPDGKYEVGALKAADYMVRVLASGYAASAPTPCSVQPPDDSQLDFRLLLGGRLKGRVVDAESNEPIYQAHITVEGGLSASELPIPYLASTTSDRQGAYVLSGLTSSLRSVHAVAQGYHRRIVSGLKIRDGADVGPVIIAMNPTQPDEEPKLELTGIGAVLSAKGEGLHVIRVFPNSGAAEAGLGPDDLILALDGTKVIDLGFRAAIERIRGPEGSSLILLVKKASAATQEIEVYRRKISN